MILYFSKTSKPRYIFYDYEFQVKGPEDENKWIKIERKKKQQQ